jgi:glucuronate isomerase
MPSRPWHFPPDRIFGPDPAQRRIAQELYEQTAAPQPLVCPHGHVDPRLFSSDHATLGTPAEMLIIPDHYIFRMLYSQGIPLEALGIPSADGTPVEEDHRKIWQLFADNFYLFRATPTAFWITHVFQEVFGIDEKLSGKTAQSIYDQLAAKASLPEFSPRALFERFRIEVLCTTDYATESLEHHQAIRDSGWAGRVRPTFRPDDVIHLLRPGWREKVRALGELVGHEIGSCSGLVRAIEDRRCFFRQMGATATDHDGISLRTGELEPEEAGRIFQRALKGEATREDAEWFLGHMLMEEARMSIEDGLVMQVHFGSHRNHNQPLYDRFGPDRGCDIPFQAEFTRNLRPLLNRYGNDPRLTLVVFTLDESTYSRELAPLAGHYPALKIGPAWWFNDSIQGMIRYREQVVETAGLYNTAGFNDDTRSFVSIPARHDLARRVDANWLAGLVVRGIADMEDAHAMMADMAYGLAKKTYKL